MRQIKYIVLHCTATPELTRIESIQKYWRETLGWRDPGYHWIIKHNGHAVQLHPIDKPSNGVKGFNANAIHISYIGGIDEKGKAKDTRSDKQKQTMYDLVKGYKEMFPDAKILGHRDFPNVAKSCPSFSVEEWCKCVGFKYEPII
jgi:N-acetylmuramoyl-L-alanine amidase